ncbi:hypothetical protein OOT46_19805 [Aquabacterium sp. A7-Y]|uniref:hypothetical protein n=1 Tax=Aquabacterium sp. A7-Y TaxID=1349605 RepID=UPI00223D6C5F|nr:hypothetical protein [Aquabacterium sp. A7-Y]MCW7540084.1 hypothetical protein [Aquabacterium sp. A7-Y]
MSDEYQIEIPPSFYALYSDARRRLTEPLAVVRARYEICEDLAHHLVEHGKTLLFSVHINEDEVLRRIYLGLQRPESGVSAPEAVWIIRRLAELLGWEAPHFDDGAG